MKIFKDQPDHNAWRRPINNSEKARLAFGLSGFLATLAWMEWSHPSMPPFHGKLAIIQYLSYEALGLHGMAYLFMGGTVFAIFLGVNLWSKK